MPSTPSAPGASRLPRGAIDGTVDCPEEVAFLRHLRAAGRVRQPGAAVRREAHQWRERLTDPLYDELAGLAAAATGERLRGAPRVLVLPGLMGSLLGRPVKGGVLWFNPLAVAAGQLPRLALPQAGAPVTALGVMPFVYLRLKLRLRAAGFDAAYWPFDWRLAPEVNAARLLAALPEGRGSQGSPTLLVAHSQGGLVAAWALQQDAAAGPRLGRVVTVGTPFNGAASTLQAMTGQYALLRRLAWLDVRHSAYELAQTPLGTWPGLAALLPPPTALFDPWQATGWPAQVTPRPAVLAAGLASRQGLQVGVTRRDVRLGCIVGQGHPTATGVVPPRVSGTDLRGPTLSFGYADSGDGTVPLASARVPGTVGTPLLEVQGTHGALPGQVAVAEAAAHFLEKGRFPARRPRPATAPRSLEDWEAEAARDVGTPGPGPLWDRLSRSAQWRFLAEWVAALPGPAPDTDSLRTLARLSRGVRPRPPPAPPPAPVPPLAVGVFRGDVAAVDADAVVVGVFRHVAPAGAAAALDGPLAGALQALLAQRLFDPAAGAVTLLPAPGLPVAQVLLVGLGDFARLDAGVLARASANVARLAAVAGLRHLGMVLLGTASGITPAAALQAQLQGLQSARLPGPAGALRISFITRNARRAAWLEQRLQSGARRGPLQGAIRWAGTAVARAADDATAGSQAGAAPGPLPAPLPAWLVVRQEQEGKRTVLRAALLTARAKAAVLAGTRPLDARQQARLLGPLLQEPNRDTVATAGRLLGGLLPDNVAAALLRTPEAPLVVVHDAPASRLPWETLTLGREAIAPALGAGLSRQLAADDLDVARWQQLRPGGGPVQVLLVMNPTGDLPGAESEGLALQALWADHAQVVVTVLAGREATRARVLEALQGGHFDLVHYAGHAMFDEVVPARSGLYCARRELLRGADVAALPRPPLLLFANACESGRVRGSRAPAVARPAVAATGLAEAFLRGGVAHYLGTWWPVGDRPAAAFATAFHTTLLAGSPCGVAVVSARQAVRAIGSADWADYLHYGDPAAGLYGAVARFT